ncbi:Ger(x)C family spore germination protein [Gorillibacterium sp. sgz5001074]|uniref:Ger(x)C family spore germination protein n=1 Tax=Gorillibacterium sp. sgz5001074 TaxID=3446695 RepID=UPI003F674626
MARDAFASKGVRLILAVWGIVLLLPLGGCITPELNERSLVSMVGIDRKENGDIRVTLGLIGSDKQAKKTEEQAPVFTAEGETLFEAARTFIRSNGNRPLWTYIKVIVIGPSAGEQDLKPLMDFFNRNNEIQPNPYIVFSTVSAEEILHLSTESPELPALVVEKQIKNQTQLSQSPVVTLYEWNEMLLRPGQTAMASLLKPVKDRDRILPVIEGAAVVRGGRTAGYLEAKETRGILWVREEVRGGVLVLPFQGSRPGEETGKAALEITGRNRAEIRPQLSGDRLSLDISVRVKLAVGEIMGGPSTEPPGIARMQQQAEERIRMEIEEALAITQKQWKADVLGIGRMVERSYPDYWLEHAEQWPDIFAAVPVRVTVQANIGKLGLLHSNSGEGTGNDG